MTTGRINQVAILMTWRPKRATRSSRDGGERATAAYVVLTEATRQLRQGHEMRGYRPLALTVFCIRRHERHTHVPAQPDKACAEHVRRYGVHPMPQGQRTDVDGHRFWIPPQWVANTGTGDRHETSFGSRMICGSWEVSSSLPIRTPGIRTK